MATVTQLSVYNRAMRILGESKLSSLTENRAVRQTLDGAWDDNHIRRCLQEGLWNFATRTRESSYDSSVTPGFGYKYAFEKPSDWVRTAGIWSDSEQTAPLVDYRDETGWWYAHFQTLYVSYVSDDSEYGSDMSLWPDNFTTFVAAKLAMDVAPTHIKGRVALERIERALKVAKSEALNTDAMDEPPRYPATGSFVRSRRGAGGERGVRGSLTG